MGLFEKIGVGPGQDVDRQDDATRRGLARAAADGRLLLREALQSGDLGSRVNGWNIPPKAMGRAGLADDFLLRGAVQCLGGIIANDSDEAIYFNTSLDGASQMLDGAKRYTMRFAPGQLPHVGAFWSLSLYDPTCNFTDNPMGRYSIGNRTTGLKQDADGGLTIHIQRNSPGVEKESNWLPCAESGQFSLILRTYMPGPKIVAGHWPPARGARGIAAPRRNTREFAMAGKKCAGVEPPGIVAAAESTGSVRMNLLGHPLPGDSRKGAYDHD